VAMSSGLKERMIDMSKGPEDLYRNLYRCSECGTEWEDEWNSTCNDRCPTCDTEIEPYKSEDIQ
jgi:rubrerythrin